MRIKALFVAGLFVVGVSLGLMACGQTQNTDLSENAVETSATQTAEDAKLTANTQEDFYISEITDEIFARIKGKSFKDDCTLPREDLRYLHVLHKDIDGNVHEGEMIVNYPIAQEVLDILRELYENEGLLPYGCAPQTESFEVPLRIS